MVGAVTNTMGHCTALLYIISVVPLGSCEQEHYKTSKVTRVQWEECNLAIVLTPSAARINLPCLPILGVVMGMGEGVAMPAMNNIISIPGGKQLKGTVILSRAPI
ncbi:hypothetical protein Nepgr_009252 [Nepenthes gracilis]|uniref:Uncharacterized protein n=1 Tax=Nepenthes gracilis TaxID=150966 RepID=A0AAD3SB32_NEPGR|nr:hypothetical protein Nepgr_009252 [Nepenthes gracilis]